MRFHVRIFFLLLVMNVCARFFTNYLGVLPRHFNVADVVLTALLLGISFLQTPVRPFHRLHRTVTGALWGIVIVGILGWFFNSYPGHVPAAVSQMVMLTEPLLLFVAISRMGLTELEVGRYVKWLELLIKLELIIGICQIPIFLATGESESIMGTFQHNAEQYAAFITLGIFFLIGKHRVEGTGNGFRKLMIVGMLTLVICIDNKASWLGLAASILAVMVALGSLERRVAGTITALVGGILILGIGLVVVTNVSGSLHKFDRLAEIWRNGEISHLGKIKALRDVVASHNEHPHMWLVGSGLGSFYSRSARQYFGNNAEALYSSRYLREETGNGELSQSDSMGGVITKADNPPYFITVQQDEDQILPLGTGQVDEPFSFYNGLLGELGLLGIIAYLLVYYRVYRFLRTLLSIYRNDDFALPLVAAAYGFLVYLACNSLYGPMLETGRMTTILWSLIACCIFLHAKTRYSNKESTRLAAS